jgi:drug/metabolite transporter (DMT)-like permease
LLLFTLVSGIWGATWIALKLGLATVPPVMFAGTRFTTAGALLLLLLHLRRDRIVIDRAHLGRLALVTVLMISVPYALLFWGTQFVTSGLSAILDLAFMPVALLGIGVLFHEDRFTLPRACGVAIGVGGILVLFGPKAIAAANPSSAAQLIGGGAIILSALVYALGSVLARPLLRAYTPVHMSALTMAGGGVILCLAALTLEPGAAHALAGNWGAPAWLGWLFLVLFGSLVAYTAYLQLVRLWGTARAGAYAFVSPIVAVILGVLIFHEHVSRTDAAGMVIMLAGAWLTLRPAEGRA